jgi:hypothetical protein
LVEETNVKRLGLIAMTMTMMSVGVMACGGGAAKKGPPAPKDKKALTAKPATATSKGKVMTKLTPPMAPAKAPQISTIQAGDDGDEEFAWQEDVDGDGTQDDVLEVVDDETGDIVLATAWSSPCDDGSSLSAAFFITVHANGTGTYLFAADDVCGEGAALFGCDFDAAGNDTNCGSCTVPADGTEFTCEDSSPASE